VFFSGSPPPAERQRILGQAREWLSATLTGWESCLNADPAKNRAEVHEQMTHWLAEAKLASVREEDSLAKLPAAEREQWRRLWAGVRNLCDKAAP
jgi:hypothetical protein